MKLKGIITVILGLYVIVSLVFVVVRETRGETDGIAEGAVEGINVSTAATEFSPPGPDLAKDRVRLFYFHRNLRCVSCLDVEEKLHEVINEHFQDAVDNGTLEVNVVNFDLAENEYLIEAYDLYYSSIVFVEVRGNTEMVWDDFAEVWAVYGNDEALRESIRSEIRKWLEGVRS